MTKKIDIDALHEEIIAQTAERFTYHEKVSLHNTQKILKAFSENKVSDYYFRAASGYGYSDTGRDTLDRIYAEIFKTEKALVRAQFVSGTHAISTALFGVLRPGDEILAATGAPYDTLQTVIGAKVPQKGSLCEHGIGYREIPLEKGHSVDLHQLKKYISSKTKLVHIQRSRGYAERDTLTVEQIGEICQSVKAIKKDCICFVDNCYGEFVEKLEPTEVGADIVAGSLIKNPGGGLVPSGGYIAGKQEFIQMAAYHYTAPGLGSEMGSVSGDTQRLLYQGLFLAPHVTLQAVKTAIYAAAIFESLGYYVSPSLNDFRSDIIQSIRLETPEALVAFCHAIQKNSPVEGHVLPMPGRMPGYQDDVIMAAGTFIQGASIELSADGPMRPPYNAYLQGGLIFEHSILAIIESAKNILKHN